MIPGYKIDRRVGRGGMGDVYLAEQESLARQVALKILSQRFEENRDFVRRFQAEARAAAALNHPNVVTVYDVGEASGKHYLSMEFMDRGNLEDRLKNGARIPEREVLDILRDATSGLVYAEARGIVHRDLKPANLMQNHVGTIKIADLGLATHVEAEESQPADKKIFGTPHFMSPEQVRGERVDSRSDLYSLGATAYRLLTGRTPFEGRDAREIVRAVLRDEPRPIREFAPEVSAATAALVERLMKKESAQRFSSASETLQEIERLRNPSQHAVTIEAGNPPRQRSKGGLVLLVLLLAGGGAAYWWKTHRTDGGWLPPRGNGPVIATEPLDPSGLDPSSNPPLDGDRTQVQPSGTGAGATTTPEKDDKELQLFEAQAKVALLELMGREMPEKDRREALRALASQFQGTSAATEALEKAEAITNRMLAEEAALAARRVEVDAMLVKLRDAARIDDVPPHPGVSFLAMRAVEGQAPLRAYPEFVDQRKTLETIVCRTAMAYADMVLTEASRTLDRGDYDGGLAQLRALMPVFDLPEFPTGEAPSGITELFEKGRIARERLHTIEQTREVFERRRDRDDAIAIAVGFGGVQGLEKEFRLLDFAAAKQRIDGILPKVASGRARALLTELSADCERARVARLAAQELHGSARKKGRDAQRDRRRCHGTAVRRRGRSLRSRALVRVRRQHEGALEALLRTPLARVDSGRSARHRRPAAHRGLPGGHRCRREDVRPAEEGQLHRIEPARHARGREHARAVGRAGARGARRNHQGIRGGRDPGDGVAADDGDAVVDVLEPDRAPAGRVPGHAAGAPDVEWQALPGTAIAAWSR